LKDVPVYVLRWEIRGESSTTGPSERTSPYHWISIPSCPHTCWALYEENFTVGYWNIYSTWYNLLEKLSTWFLKEKPSTFIITKSLGLPTCIQF